MNLVEMSKWLSRWLSLLHKPAFLIKHWLNVYTQKFFDLNHEFILTDRKLLKRIFSTLCSILEICSKGFLTVSTRNMFSHMNKNMFTWEYNKLNYFNNFWPLFVEPLCHNHRQNNLTFLGLNYKNIINYKLSWNTHLLMVILFSQK